MNRKMLILTPRKGNQILERFDNDPYKIYNYKSALEDQEFVNDCNSSMDTLLIFVSFISRCLCGELTRNKAGLFSAVATSVIQATYVLLASQSGSTDHSSAIGINTLFFSSLVLSLLTALAAMLIKQWARQYRMGLGDGIIPWTLARFRHERYIGLRESPLPDMIAWTPILMHSSLLLFMIGAVWWLHSLHAVVTLGVVTALTASGLIGYGALAFIPKIYPNSPFVWPSFHRQQPTIQDSAEIKVEVSRTPFYDLKPTACRSSHASPREQMMPPDIKNLDYGILLHVLKNTDSLHEAEVVIDSIRLFQTSGFWSDAVVTVDGSVILRTCQKLANTCWTSNDAYRCVLRPGMVDRARRVCRFIEWLYIHLSVEDRHIIQESKSLWPSSSVAEALAQDAQNTRRFEDTVLAILTKSKLHHVNNISRDSMNPSDGCRHCWNRDPFGTLHYLEFTHIRRNAFEATRMQELVTCAIIADSECLLNYSKVSTLEQFRNDIEPSLERRVSLMVEYCKDSGENYKELKQYLFRQFGESPGHFNQWFRDLYEAAWYPNEARYNALPKSSELSKSMVFGRP
jgi:hypothetical protein